MSETRNVQGSRPILDILLLLPNQNGRELVITISLLIRDVGETRS